MEGILHRALALVVSLYCNLFPPPDVPLSKHGNVHPQIPVQTYQVVATCLRGPWLTEVTGTATWVLGAGEQTRRARNREADRQTYRQNRQKEVSDICSGQLMTPGWPGGVRGDRGQKRVDNSHKCCNGWYFEFNSLPGSARLNWFIISYHFTQNFPFYMLFWFSAELSDNGRRWLLLEPL